PRASTSERPVDDLVEDETQALASVAEGVERPRLDERLDRPLVEHDRVDTSADVVEVAERAASFSLGDDVADEPFADVAHGGEPKRDHPGTVGGIAVGSRSSDEARRR